MLSLLNRWLAQCFLFRTLLSAHYFSEERVCGLGVESSLRSLGEAGGDIGLVVRRGES
jgi:hypothetical protein